MKTLSVMSFSNTHEDKTIYQFYAIHSIKIDQRYEKRGAMGTPD